MHGVLNSGVDVLGDEAKQTICGRAARRVLVWLLVGNFRGAHWAVQAVLVHHKHFIRHVHRLLLQHILQVLRALKVTDRLVVDVISLASGTLLSLFGFHVMVDLGLARDPLDLFPLLARRRMDNSALRRLSGESSAGDFGLLSHLGGSAL